MAVGSWPQTAGVRVHAGCREGRYGSGPLLGMAVDVRRRRGAWLMRALVAAVHVGQRCWAGWWQIGG